MNEDVPLPQFARGSAAAGRRQVLGRLARLAVKELREILRDRRTIITLVVMPLLLYPLLAMVFQRFLMTSITTDGSVEYIIGVDSERSWERLGRQIARGDAILRRELADDQQLSDEDGDAAASGDERELPLGRLMVRHEGEARPTIRGAVFPADMLQRQVADASLHLAAVPRYEDQLNDGEHEDGLGRRLTWDLYYRASPTSEAALRFVASRIHAYADAQLDQQLKVLGVSAVLPAVTEHHSLDFSGAPVFSLAALIPLILVLMTVTGAVYPAIDLTAGERERGTLEMLIAAPVPRAGLLMAKYVAVLTVAVLTAVVNLTGMAITSHSTGLNASLFGGAGLSLTVIAKVLLLLGLFAAFFSAVLLAITSYARSFKEAQAYIIPLMLLCLVPGIVCLMPSLQFSGWLAVTPLVNIVLLARDVLEGNVDPRLAAAAVGSTAVYVMAAIAVAARIFGTDAILYGSQATWTDIFRRPTEQHEVASMPAALFGLAIIFPAYFLLGNELARAVGWTMTQRLVTSGLVTIAVFGGIPLGVAMLNRVRLKSGLALTAPGMAAFVGAALIGASLWPFVHELVLLAGWLDWFTLRPEQVSAANQMLNQWQAISPALILMVFALLAGVFEELTFRGFFFTSLRTILSPWATIVATAVLFGAMHEALAPGRILPSTFLGLVLGWVRYRTGSVLPCMVLHILHNGLLLSIAYWRDDLAARGFGIEESAHVPLLWLAIAGAGVCAGVALLTISKPAFKLED